MKLRKIEFEGIRAFADKTVFRFGSSAGLYFLQGGENEVDPELGSNGVGKSTLWLVLCWILFGKTAEGLKAGDLKSWQSNKKGYYGTLWAGRDVIKRSWKPNKLTFNGKVVEQKTLEDKLGISFETFTTAVLLSQGQDMFFDLMPTKKLSVFTSLLNLDNWIGYSDRAKETALDVGVFIQQQENRISKTEGRIDGLDVEGLQERSEQFKKERYKELVSTRGQYAEIKHDFSEIELRVKRSKKNRARLRRHIRKFRAKKQEAEDAAEKLELTLSKVRDQLLEVLPRIAIAEEKVEFFEKHKNEKCVSCNQHISPKVATKQLAVLTARIVFISETSKPLVRRKKILDRRATQIKGAILAYSNDLRDSERSKSKAEDRYAELLEDFAKVKAAKQISKDRFERAKKSTNPYKGLVQKKSRQEDKLIEKLKYSQHRRDKLQRKKDDIEFWVQGFKSIRLYLIEEALLQLELATNKALAELGFSSEWGIKYSIEKTTKRGSLISGFNVLVKSPHSEKQVPFSVWSGGEKQRLKIAGSMGFISLVYDRTGLDLGLEVYDEPTQHLSPEGIDSLLKALHSRAMQTGKRIWLVDHHTLDYGDFAGHVVVNKDSEGRSELCVGI